MIIKVMIFFFILPPSIRPLFRSFVLFIFLVFFSFCRSFNNRMEILSDIMQDHPITKYIYYIKIYIQKYIFAQASTLNKNHNKKMKKMKEMFILKSYYDKNDNIQHIFTTKKEKIMMKKLNKKKLLKNINKKKNIVPLKNIEYPYLYVSVVFFLFFFLLLIPRHFR